jgi:hypothetical protein
MMLLLLLLPITDDRYFPRLQPGHCDGDQAIRPINPADFVYRILGFHDVPG